MVKEMVREMSGVMVIVREMRGSGGDDEEDEKAVEMAREMNVNCGDGEGVEKGCGE